MSHTQGVQQWTGRESRKLRHALRMTQREFAERLGVNHRMISKWEAGGADITPRAVNQQALDTMLQRADDDARARFESELHSPLSAVSLPAFEARNGDPADSDFVNDLQATIRHLVALDGAHGGTEVAPLAVRTFRRAQRVLGEGHYRPAVERDLEAVTAELGELAGWLLFDAARYAESRQVNAEALTLARIAGDASMEHFVLSNQALASIHIGRNREALRIAQGAICGHGVSGRVRALFDVRAARALAGLDDSPAALDRFDRARSAFQDGVTPRDPAWSWWFDERELAGHLGMIHAALGDPHRAMPQLAAAVERSEGRDHFRWALYIHRANLLRALLRVESWEEAERVALDVAPLVGDVASGRTEGILTEATALPCLQRAPSSLRDVLEHIRRVIPQR